MCWCVCWCLCICTCVRVCVCLCVSNVVRVQCTFEPLRIVGGDYTVCVFWGNVGVLGVWRGDVGIGKGVCMLRKGRSACVRWGGMEGCVRARRGRLCVYVWKERECACTWRVCVHECLQKQGHQVDVTS